MEEKLEFKNDISVSQPETIETTPKKEAGKKQFMPNFLKSLKKKLRKKDAKEKREDKKKFLEKTWQKIVFAILAIILIALVALATYTYSVLRGAMSNIESSRALAWETLQIAKSQNLPALPEKITALSEEKAKLYQSFEKLSIYGKLPIVKKYYQDANTLFAVADHALIAAEKGVNALLPYSDLLGFAGAGSFTGGTTQDRIVLILETLDEIQPTIDELEIEIQSIESLINEIDANRYPEKIRDQALRSMISSAQEQVSLTSQTFTDYKPIISQLSKMAGAKEAQKYLVLFQNDNELRPTGGFLTAYSIIKLDKGTVIPEKSDDIYELDQKFNQRIAIPESLGKYLTTEKYWNLRDMNISPDFKTSMEAFYEHYQAVPGEPDDIDGIIAVDTYVLTKLLEVIGPVNAPGYGTFSAEIDSRCDCPQVVYGLSEIITRPTPYLREDRKGILGPLMKSILTKTYELDNAKFPELFTVAIDSLEGRHVQMYFIDEDSQMAAEKINAAGRLYEQLPSLRGYEMGKDLDFLAIVDANLGGAKSNLFTEYEVKQIVTAPLDGFLEKTLEISYKNTHQADNCNLEAGLLCLNATLNDWLRIYLPMGSELIEIQGIENEADIYEESGLTVIDGYFKLEPMGLAKIKLTYKVPYTDQANYNLKMWKQGGIDAVPVLIDVTGGEEELLLDKDLEYSTIF